MSEINKDKFLAGCKGYLMQVTSISHFPKEMEVLDKILLKMWQAGLLEKDIIIDRINPSPDENTPRGTKVYVRDMEDEEWQEARFSDIAMAEEEYKYLVYCDCKGDPCEREQADGVVRYKYCKLAKE